MAHESNHRFQGASVSDHMGSMFTTVDDASDLGNALVDVTMPVRSASLRMFRSSSRDSSAALRESRY
jgi:hypothetical protein